MVKKSKLLAAFDAHKGKDYKLEKQKKFQKQAVKRKRLNPLKENPDTELESLGAAIAVNGSSFPPEAESEGWESDEREGTVPVAIDISRIDDSDSESDRSLDIASPDQRVLAFRGGEEDEEEEDAEEEEDDDDDGIPLSDIEDLSEEEKADIVPHQRLTINNAAALLRAHRSIALPISKLPFSEHQTINSPAQILIPDINDDLHRELAFYKQSLDAATEAWRLLKKEGVPFSRPTDYFAEMVKSDEHMGKIKQKMTDEAANKKASAEARKQRDLKKFGKQVQIAKLQERDKAKRETLDKIDLLKRKRRNTDTTTAHEEDLFEVALEGANKADNSARATRNGGDARTQNKRRKKNEKFGFGGKKRFFKSGDAASSADLRGFSTRKMKGAGKGSQRLGKSRRAKRT